MDYPLQGEESGVMSFLPSAPSALTNFSEQHSITPVETRAAYTKPCPHTPLQV